MRILVVCDNQPFPLTNGQNLRIYNYVQELKGRHNFDLLCVSAEPVHEPVRTLFGQIQVLPPFAGAERGGLFLRLSVSAEQLVLPHPSLGAALQRAVQAGAYDLIWFSGGGTMNAHYVHEAAVPVLADIVDSLTLTQYREFRHARGVTEFLRQGKRVLATALFERKFFRRADHAVLVSEPDARAFRRLCPNVPVSVVHNGVDETAFSPPPVRTRQPVLAFEGNMGFEPNIEAAEWLCQTIMPRIWVGRPDARAIIIGKDPAPRVRSLANDRVQVTGTVDDIRPWLNEAAVFVCPMRTGAGIKNKILQAWAMGMPTVATPLATGGLQAHAEVNILLEGQPEGFARRVLQVFNDPSLGDRIGAAARQTIVDGYSWRMKARELEHVFHSMVPNAKHASTSKHAANVIQS